MKHLWASLISISLLAGACAADDPNQLPVVSDQTAILGGTPVQLGEWKSVVAIRLAGGLCTGALIAPDTVLTAAHCVSALALQMAGINIQQDQIAGQIQVVFDSTNGIFGGRVVGATSVMPLPDFTAAGKPDLGIIKLKEKITDRKPIPVNLDASKVTIGTQLTIVGYGMSQAGNTGSAGTENVVNDKVVSCTAFNLPDATFACISLTDGTGTCEGDSGGPSFAMIDGQLKQVAVTSVGDQNCAIGSALMRTDAGKAFLLANAGGAFCDADGSCNTDCGKDGLAADPDCQSCSGNDDCGSADVCQNNVCVPGPGSAGGAGAPCTGNADCLSGTCGNVGNENRCTQTCTPGAASSCPDGFDCISPGACWPGAGLTDHTQPGGCSVGTSRRGADAAAGSLALLVMLGGVLARRRRRA